MREPLLIIIFIKHVINLTNCRNILIWNDLCADNAYDSLRLARNLTILSLSAFNCQRSALPQVQGSSGSSVLYNYPTEFSNFCSNQ